MAVYCGLLGATMILLSIYNKHKNKIFAILPFVLMALVCGLRNGVGRDYQNYVWMMRDIKNGVTTIGDVEWGFWLLVKFVQLIGGSNQVVFLVLACLTCYFYYMFIMEHSDNFALASFLYLCMGPFYFSSFNTMRESLTVAMCLCSLKYFNKNTLKFYLMVFTAILFHNSAIVFLFLPLTRYLRQKYSLYLLVSGFILFLLIQLGLIEWLISAFLPAYDGYITRENAMDISYALFLLFYIVAIVLIPRANIEIEKVFMYLMVFSSALILCALTTNKLTMMLTRLVQYGSPCFIIVVPKLAAIVKQKQIYYAAVVGFAVVYYLYVCSTGIDMLPYNANFQMFA